MSARLPLTAAQTGIWYAQRLDPSNPIYNGGEYLRIDGPVDADLFEQALRRTVTETDALRVRFVEDVDGPGQLVSSTVDWTLERVDVSAAADPLAAAEAWMWAELSRPVDLTTGPVFAYALLRLADDRFCWYHRCHHIALDGFGGALVAVRAAEIYTALVAGTEPGDHPFPPLADLVAADLAYRTGSDFAADKAYWADRLADAPAPVGLAEGPPVMPHRLLRRGAGLDPAGTERLRELASAAGISRPPLITALVAGYLQRLTGAAEVVLGLPVSARRGRDARSVPGMVSNVLPLRVPARPGQSIGELGRQVSAEMRAGLRHQRYRFEDMRRDLKQLGDERRLVGPQVNIMSFEHALDFAGLPAVPHSLALGPVDDLSVVVYDRGAGLHIDFEGNPDLYDEDTLGRHLQRFLTFVDGVVAAGADGLLGRVDVVGDAERAVLVGPGEAVPPPDEGPPALLTDRFAAAVRAWPDATAVTFDGQQLTYRELDRRANRLARRLIAAGAAPERLVALALPRGVELVVALLAVVKSGAGYLPLDPQYPADRLAYTVADARPAVVVATGATLESVSTVDAAIPRLILDDPDPSGVGDAPVTDADRITPLHPDAPAYVIYTSGSTGRPKGVVVSHRNVTRLFSTTDAWFGFGPQDVWTLFHSYAFDFSVWELWGALLYGGRLVVVPYEVSRTPGDFHALLAAEGVTVLNQTPSAFAQLMTADAQSPAALALRYIVFGGEALDLARLAGWYDRHDDRAPVLVNMYGITETTVHVSYLPLGRQAAAEATGSTIGAALPDLRVYVLDTAMRPSPVGVAGELYVAGEGLARGYLNRPALTAERFVADPFGPPGTRVYRSGDVGRWTAGGTLEYLGRADDQVKIRGFRIELGEIEAALTGHPDVAEATVLVREDRPGDKQLVAYLVPAGGAGTVDGAVLRKHAGLSLPEHMVPAAYVAIDRVPLTPNGKLDRRALPAPDREAATSATVPRNPREEILCRLFAEALQLRRIGPADNFFDLGGHSVVASRLLAAVRETFGVDLSIRALFESPTPEVFAARLDAGTPAGSPFDVLLPLRPDGDRPPLFCVHPAGGLSWCYSGLIKHLAAGTPVYGLQARGLDGDAAMPAGIEQMAADYVAQIRTVFPDGPYHLVGYSAGGVIVHAMATQLQRDGAEVGLLAVLDTYPNQKLPPITEQDVLADLLTWVGHDRRYMGDGPLTHDAVTAVLRRLGSALASLEPRHVAAISSVYANNRNLFDGYRPRVFTGDMLLVVATLDKIDISPTPATWQPYVTGAIDVVELDRQHTDLMKPGPLADIGRILDDRL